MTSKQQQLAKRDFQGHTNGAQIGSFIAVLLLLFILFPALGIWRRRRAILRGDRMMSQWEAEARRRAEAAQREIPKLWDLYLNDAVCTNSKGWHELTPFAVREEKSGLAPASPTNKGAKKDTASSCASSSHSNHGDSVSLAMLITMPQPPHERQDTQPPCLTIGVTHVTDASIDEWRAELDKDG